MDHAIGLQAMKGSGAALGSIYASAAADVLSELKSMSPEDYTTTRAGQSRWKIGQIVSALNFNARKWVDESIPRAYRTTAQSASRRCLVLGGQQSKRFNTERHEKAASKLADSTFKDLYKANNSILETAGKYLATLGFSKSRMDAYLMQAFDSKELEGWIDDLIGDASLTGESRTSVYAQIRDRLLDKVKGKDFIEINGRNYNLRNYAELVAGYRMREAATEATLNSAAEYNHDLVEIPDDGNPCVICAEIQGKVYSISGDSDDYPELTDDITPPIHPWCFPRHMRVLTDQGLRQIGDLKVGDSVLTHAGRYRPIVHLMKHAFTGNLIVWNGLAMTPDHRVFTGRGLVPAGELTGTDQIFELSLESRRIARINLESNYFPSARAKSIIADGVGIFSAGMAAAVDFKGNISNGEVNQITTENKLLHKWNPILFQKLSRLLGHFGRIIQKIFSSRLRYFAVDKRIGGGVALSHTDQIFLEGDGFSVRDSARLISADGPPLNSEKIKNIYTGMRVIPAQPNHGPDFSHCFPGIIKFADNIGQGAVEFFLHLFKTIGGFFYSPATHGTGDKVFRFGHPTANGADVCHDVFILSCEGPHSPTMLPYSGEVFNIEVEKDHSYVAEGYLVSNCRHYLRIVSEEILARRSA